MSAGTPASYAALAGTRDRDARARRPGGLARTAVDDVAHLYEIHAAAYDRARDRSGMEAAYLRQLVDGLPPGPATVLDLGCGAGAPIAAWLMAAGCQVTGVDAAPAMLALARARLPAATWIEHDMRSLALGARFLAIVAWDSFFHLRRDAQRAMFSVFRDHLVEGGLLLFTSGHTDGEAIGQVNGAPLYHASLDPAAYARLLDQHGLDVVLYRAQDPACGDHTVWLARAR